MGKKKHGLYSVKLAYNLLMEETPMWELASKVWIKNLIPKIGFFMWVAIQNKILTLDNLRKKGFSLANRCTLCNSYEEIVNHLLLHFTISKEVINLVLQKIGRSWVFSRTLFETQQ